MDSTLRIAGTIKESIVDGPGVRYVIFTQGCPHDCKGCHNPQTHDMRGGFEVRTEWLISDIQSNPYTDGVTISGGEPFVQPDSCAELVTKLKSEERHIVAYTGFTIEQLLASQNISIRRILANIDILIDGKFMEDKKNLTLPYRGSTNQRVIDVQKTLRQNKVVEKDLDSEDSIDIYSEVASKGKIKIEG